MDDDVCRLAAHDQDIHQCHDTPHRRDDPDFEALHLRPVMLRHHNIRRLNCWITDALQSCRSQLGHGPYSIRPGALRHHECDGRTVLFLDRFDHCDRFRLRSFAWIHCMEHTDAHPY